MFPGTSDPTFAGKEWTEQTANNLPADRRFVQSAGPFTLEPGAVNEITTGVVWARAKSGGQTASVQLLKIYDREAQALFDNNFNILNGPDAPDLTLRELDQELIISLSNKASSNNFDESYSEKDPYITKPDNLLNDPDYEFQGYLVYQLKNSTVSVTDLNDNDKARLVFRSDVKDDVKGIVNQYLDPILGVYTPIEEVSSVLSSGVVGNINEGVEFSFRLIADKFALGSPKLVNHKTYYFMSLAYGYNRSEENASPYAVNDFDYDGRNQPFIAGRRNIQVYSAIPHYTESENGGTTLNAAYGDGVEITRIEGTGNGGSFLDLTEESITELLASEEHRVLQPVYKQGLGPVNFEVVDPMKIPAGNFMLKLENAVFSSNPGGDQTGLITSYGSWVLTNENTGEVVANENTDISTGSEKYITELGFNIKIKQFDNPGTDPLLNENNGFISSEIEYSNKNDRWLTGLADRDPAFPNAYGLNWIRSGSFADEDNALMSDYNVADDPNGVFEGAIIQTNILDIQFNNESTGATWAPYCFASDFTDGPGFKLGGMHSYTMSDIQDLNSVDIIFTSDKSKWTRACVVEAQDNVALAEGNKLKMELRHSPSVDKEGNDDVNDTTFGMGWFPGYALDIETGERLNIIFAEDSWQKDSLLNGNDMLWNPTSQILGGDFTLGVDPISDEFGITGGDYLMGGKHFIYIVKGESWVKGSKEYLSEPLSKDKYSPNYDEGRWIYNQLSDPSNTSGRWNVFKNISWVGIPLLAPGKTLLTSDVTVKLRVAKPFKQYETSLSNTFYERSTSQNPDLVNDTLQDGKTYTVAYINTTQTWGGKKVVYNDSTYLPGQQFVVDENISVIFTSSSNKARVIEADAVNSFNPIYRFSTDDIVATTGNLNAAKDAMDNIRAVPNPYYGKSTYETNQLDNRVKITNLPQKATISIFSVSGTLIRKLKKDDNMTSIDWDLKNDYGIPIASGLYVIHINSPGIGEKIINWFGSLRPIDLDTF